MKSRRTSKIDGPGASSSAKIRPHSPTISPKASSWPPVEVLEVVSSVVLSAVVLSVVSVVVVAAVLVLDVAAVLVPWVAVAADAAPVDVPSVAAVVDRVPGSVCDPVLASLRLAEALGPPALVEVAAVVAVVVAVVSVSPLCVGVHASARPTHTGRRAHLDFRIRIMRGV